MYCGCVCESGREREKESDEPGERESGREREGGSQRPTETVACIDFNPDDVDPAFLPQR